MRPSSTGEGMETWLEAISSARVSPASGSAAALSGALGHALLIKLARLEGWSAIPEHEGLLAQLLAARDMLVELAEEDGKALAASWPRIPRQYTGGSMEGEPLEALVSVPRQGAELCLETLARVQPLLGAVRAVAQPDAQIAVQLLETCQQAMERLLQANLERFPGLE